MNLDMPRNRPERSREEKSAEIVAIAQRLFLEHGYDGATMAAIAREAGIATNVVHWYFATKDELFVAVMEALQLEDLKEGAERFASMQGPLPRRPLGRMRGLRPLPATPQKHRGPGAGLVVHLNHHPAGDGRPTLTAKH